MNLLMDALVWLGEPTHWVEQLRSLCDFFNTSA